MGETSGWSSDPFRNICEGTPHFPDDFMASYFDINSSCLDAPGGSAQEIMDITDHTDLDFMDLLDQPSSASSTAVDNRIDSIDKEMTNPSGGTILPGTGNETWDLILKLYNQMQALEGKIMDLQESHNKALAALSATVDEARHEFARIGAEVRQVMGGEGKADKME